MSRAKRRRWREASSRSWSFRATPSVSHDICSAGVWFRPMTDSTAERSPRRLAAMPAALPAAFVTKASLPFGCGFGCGAIRSLSGVGAVRTCCLTCSQWALPGETSWTAGALARLVITDNRGSCGFSVADAFPNVSTDALEDIALAVYSSSVE